MDDKTPAELADAFWKTVLPKDEPKFHRTALADLAELLDEE